MPKPTLEVEILHKPQLQQVDFTFEMMGFEFSSSSTSDWNQFEATKESSAMIRLCLKISVQDRVPVQMLPLMVAGKYWSSPPPSTNQEQQLACNLQFSNNTAFWNPSATWTNAKSDFLSPPFEEKPSSPT
ncbi:hypothetical protein V6N12_069356 [Hibiscus sabdariffa]|uniref:Uncharacterized protein n=1 Tax=Hibiscus sabdariffa TaxID=183260 RepID=A0ABR2FE03_9ROSI